MKGPGKALEWEHSKNEGGPGKALGQGQSKNEGPR
jgi:hypothetical protein